MRDTVSPRELKLKDYSLYGVSTAGIGTCVTVPEWKIGFDTAQGLPFAVPMRTFLITHLHQDHGGGIPYLISQKAMNGHRPPIFYLPPGTAEKLTSIIRLWEELENHTYEFIFKELPPGQREPLHGDLYVESFATKHRVACQGYTVFEKRKSLKKELAGQPEESIVELRRKGENVQETVFLPKISFTGDTQIEFLDLSPQVRDSETLIMEVTYVDEKKSVSSAREWGHIHMDEVIERIPKIKSKNIVWIHLSARHSRHEVRELIDERLPNDKDRIHLL